MPADDKRKRIMERLRPYKGFVFRWQRYKELAPDWDHDHCNGCWARFAERPGDWNDTVHTEGWVTLWPLKITRQEEEEQVAKWRAAGMRLVPAPRLDGVQLDWVCPECFEICRQELAFVVDPEHPQWQRAGL